MLTYVACIIAFSGLNLQHYLRITRFFPSPRQTCRIGRGQHLDVFMFLHSSEVLFEFFGIPPCVVVPRHAEDHEDEPFDLDKGIVLFFFALSRNIIPLAPSPQGRTFSVKRFVPCGRRLRA